MKSIAARAIAVLFVLGVMVSARAIAQQYPAPHLVGITSPGDGTVEIVMEVRADASGSIGAFLVYRREGNHTSPEQFTMLTRSGYPHYFMDTTGSPEFGTEEGLIKVIISGMKSGECSYYLTQVAPWRKGSESVPSNILSVRVAGTNTEDGDIEGNVVMQPSSVEMPIAIDDVAPYPNPTAGTIHIPLDGAAAGVVRLFNAAGAEVMEGRVDAAAREYLLDLSGFPQGLYYAEIVRGARRTRARFMVTR